MATLAAAIGRLGEGAAGLAALRGDVEARSWPLSETFGAEPEATWYPPELLAHVGEMIPYWLGEIERILAEGPAPVPFGRIQTDDVRIAVIGRDRTIPPRELFARIAADADRVGRRLAELSDAEVARAGLHPTRGEMTIDVLVERMIVGHLEDHVRQLREILDAESA